MGKGFRCGSSHGSATELISISSARRVRGGYGIPPERFAGRVGGVDECRGERPYPQRRELRGANIFASTGNGIPGIYDLPGGKFRLEPPEETPQVVAIGSVIEAGVNWSTRNLNNRLNQLGIPATFVYRETGTHSWGYWQDDLESSWPTLAKGLGLYGAP
ncbi:hypothetical protein APR12_004848 [Nocardia amikacinitolerans]|uniref:hypothetical protein n=1 Tax=Nocardia amikacinitolerans TaxID=756689 RepID=UPI0008336DB8|nr:hypothetical protein [Nocardia amikacinitolerans]MCP2319480.1 hypothetical protein [Nocardia amikacinitolerans]